jgi:F-type H+-transporting ATPase subunit b
MHTHLATFLFQTANFLILVGVLRYWLYRPVLAMIARRQQEVEAPLAAAAAERAKASELRAEVERQHADAAGEHDRLLLEAGRQAQARREQLLDEARRAADVLVAAGRETLRRERAAAESKLQAEAASVAVGLATKLLAASGAVGPTEHLLDEAVRLVEAMNGAGRGRAAQAGALPVQVVTALPLEPARRETIATRLHRTLGDALRVTFAEDPALLAGAEIHLPTAVVRQTWREQLALAQRELAGP